MANFESENQLIGNIFAIPKFPSIVNYHPKFSGPTDDFQDFSISSVQNFLQALSDNKVSPEKKYILRINISPAKLYKKNEWLEMMRQIFDGLRCSVNFHISERNEHSIGLVFSSEFDQTVYNFHRAVPENEHR